MATRRSLGGRQLQLGVGVHPRKAPNNAGGRVGREKEDQPIAQGTATTAPSVIASRRLSPPKARLGSSVASPVAPRTRSVSPPPAITRHNASPPPATGRLMTPRGNVPSEKNISRPASARRGGMSTAASNHQQVATPRGVLGKPPHTNDSRVKVCVRLRPLGAVEEESEENSILKCSAASPGTLWYLRPSDSGDSNSKPAEHKFDWVLSGDTLQAAVMDALGIDVTQGVASGFNGCIFAYGQTGSGKSYTIFGKPGDERGLLPRVVEDLFSELAKAETKYLVKLSYLELYNERARDLLLPSMTSLPNSPSLEIRQHPKFGVFVDGLTCSVVESVEDASNLIDFGNKSRVVGCTNINAASSRSHALVTLEVQRVITDSAGVSSKKQRAQLHAIDLAGSERLRDAGGSNLRQKESMSINKSLLALTVMIAKLAKQRDAHIPFRDSKLTFLLSDALMGNCRTAMVACVSPAASASIMTESTLRFASSVKTLKTKPVKNEEAEGHLIQLLYAEIEKLKDQLRESENKGRRASISDQIATTLYLQERLGTTWEEQQEESRKQTRARTRTLTDLGFVVGGGAEQSTSKDTYNCDDDEEGAGGQCESEPYLINECNDPLLSGCLRIRLPRGIPVQIGSDPSSTLVLDGLGVQPAMCSVLWSEGCSVRVTNTGAHDDDDHRTGSKPSSCGTSLFKSGRPELFLNDELATKTFEMHHSDKLRVGVAYVFSLVVPGEAAAFVRTESRRTRDIERYETELKNKLGAVHAQRIIRELVVLQNLAEEANKITEELRGGNLAYRLAFKTHVLADPLAMDVGPDLVVALRRTTALKSVDDASQSNSSGTSFSNVAIWSREKFKERLEIMRDLYKDVSERSMPWDEAADRNPWTDGDVIVPTAPTSTRRRPSSIEEPQARRSLFNKSEFLPFERRSLFNKSEFLPFEPQAVHRMRSRTPSFSSSQSPSLRARAATEPYSSAEAKDTPPSFGGEVNGILPKTGC